ncbi:MAG TPA: hypothetical protein EYP90_02400 [Chromatiaceae bacterium]|nr:hypothetical protein [Chromatiaceae bacterium]
MSNEGTLKYLMKKDLLVVENMYYNITIDLANGGRIVRWFSKLTNNEYIPYNRTNDILLYPQAEIIAVNPVGEYPYVLMNSKWESNVIVDTNETLVILLKPLMNSDIRRQLNNLNFTKVITFYKDTPYIDINYLITNPSNESRIICSILNELNGKCDYGLTIEWTVGNKSISGWYHIIKLQNSTGVYIIEGIYDGKTFGPLELGIQGVFWVGAYNKFSKDFAGILIKEPNTVYTAYLSNKINNFSVIRFRVSFNKTAIAPLSAISYNIRVYYGPYSPRWLEESGFKGLAKHIDDIEFSRYETLVTYGIELLKEREEVINELKNSLTTLNMSLQTCLNQLETFKKVYNDLQKEYDDLLNKVKDLENNLALYVGISLVIGLAIGVAVGYSVKKRT